jgi:hypothetical protein
MEHDDAMSLAEKIAITKTKMAHRNEQLNIEPGRHAVDISTHVSGHVIADKTKTQESLSYKKLALIALHKMNEKKARRTMEEYFEAHHNEEKDEDEMEAEYPDGKARVKEIKNNMPSRHTKRIYKSSNFNIRKIG